MSRPGPMAHIGHGSVIVERPPNAIKKELSWFDCVRGKYEDLFTFYPERNVLITMPGFAQRISMLLPTVDERTPMPKANMEAALSGLHEAWHGVVRKALSAGGGMVSIPDILGQVEFAAALLKAFPHERMLARGAPISVVAVANLDFARFVFDELKKKLPGGREIGYGGCSDSDDIIVVSYGTLPDIPWHLVGLAIGLDLAECNVRDLAGPMSKLRHAARWGVWSTPRGGNVDIILPMEGLFGPLVASATFGHAADAGISDAVTVCWLPCPQPNTLLGRGKPELLEAIAMQNNPKFLDLAAEIVRSVSGDDGCLLYAGNLATVRRVAERVPGAVVVDRKVPLYGRRSVYNDMAIGNARKVLTLPKYCPAEIPMTVMVVASCMGGSAISQRMLWHRRGDKPRRAYIVDFTHKWDVHNGRPGILNMNDESRKRLYQEFGYVQMYLNNINELPFL